MCKAVRYWLLGMGIVMYLGRIAMFLGLIPMDNHNYEIALFVSILCLGFWYVGECIRQKRDEH